MSAGAAHKPIVVDASVASKWLLRGETQLEAADALLRAHNSGKVTLTAPQQIEVEVASSVRKAVLNGRVGRSRGDEPLTEWLDTSAVRLQLVPTTPFLPAAWTLSFRLGISLFDGLYIALAEELGIDVIVADDRLLRSAAGRLPFVHALSGYTLGMMG